MSQSVQGAFTQAFIITPNDSANISFSNLAFTTSGIHALQTGNINVVFANPHPTANVPNVVLPVVTGTYYPYRIVKLYSTGTTANVHGLR